MNIVHLNWSLGTGGTETMLVDIANEQSQMGHRVSIICLNNLIYEPIRRSISSHVDFYCLNRRPHTLGLVAIFRMNLLLHKINPDIIHVHPNGLARLIKLGNYKMIRTIHSTQGDGKDSYLFDKLCFISEAVRRHSLQQGFDGIVVYNGIKTDLIKVKRDRLENKPIIHIVQIGRLEDFKGQHILLKALSKLKEEGYNNLRVDFIGEGSYESILRALVNELNLGSIVKFLGQKSRCYIYQHICDYDLFIQPSLSEGFGLTIAEAMVAKVPVITSDLDGPLEVIGNGQYGLSFKSGDFILLSETIKKVIHQDLPFNLDDARQFVLNNFSISRTATNYIKIYSEVIEKNNYRCKCNWFNLFKKSL